MPDTPLKVGLISLGCAKNLVDSEVMLGTLRRAGLELTGDPRQADVVIVNTCGFVESAKQESLDAVLKANELRQTGRCRALIMAGCLAQRYPKDLQKDLPEVDAFIGLNEVPRIAEIVQRIVGQPSWLSISAKDGTAKDNLEACPTVFHSGPAKYVPDYTAPRLRLTPAHYAYVKIAEGCNHPCTFCSIPRIRGRHRSRSVADVVAEARALVADGVRELNLISQDTTFYGKDIGTSLPVLLRALQGIGGDFWIRLLYTHPAHWSDELIATIADCDKVCRYVDMPLQHINDEMLHAMRRETDGAFIRDLVARIRRGIPGIALRTTFIVGFPDETEEQFAELLAFIEQARFERLGVFAYSQEDHTPAGNMAGQLPAKIKQARRQRAMALQQRVARQIHASMIGRTLRVLVDEPKLARSHADAPEIDGNVLLRGAAPVGKFVDVCVTGAKEYDLRAVLLQRR